MSSYFGTWEFLPFTFSAIIPPGVSALGSIVIPKQCRLIGFCCGIMSDTSMATIRSVNIATAPGSIINAGSYVVNGNNGAGVNATITAWVLMIVQFIG